MANRVFPTRDNSNGPAVPTALLDTTGQLVIGNADIGAVSSMLLEISGTFSGSLVLRARITGGIATNAAANTVPYKNLLLLPASQDTAAGTAITAAARVKVEIDVSQLILDYTATSGTMVVEYRPFVG